MSITAQEIRDVVKRVTNTWTKQRKAEERGRRSRESRGLHGGRVKFTDVADDILPGAYGHASGDGSYPVSKRQLYYACREAFKQRTGRELPADYFSNTLLVQYVNRHQDETALWKITADPRGTLAIPNTTYEARVPCGTLAIEQHLREAGMPIDSLDFRIGVPIGWPSLRHGERYQAVLYIEKEGFEPLLRAARIAERFDVAILSCKGQSVVAARRYVDKVCGGDDGIPLLVVHDFDKAGFEISQRLTTVSEWAEANDRVAYRFQNEINVTDLGLRLADVETYNLAEETVEFRGAFAPDSIATPGEQAFLSSGRRVELNAFTSPEFIAWLESKLQEQGLGKRLVPSEELLEAAYRRATGIAHMNRGIATLAEEARLRAEEAVMPEGTQRKLRAAMAQEPDEAWDVVLYRLVTA